MFILFNCVLLLKAVLIFFSNLVIADSITFGPLGMLFVVFLNKSSCNLLLINPWLVTACYFNLASYFILSNLEFKSVILDLGV